MASSFTIFSIFAVNKIDQLLVCYCVFQGGTNMSKKDKSKGDPITMLTVKKLNASIAKTVKEISSLMQEGGLKDPVKVELLGLYKEHLKFLRGQVKDLTDAAPKTWDGLAMRAFTDDK